jgi:hypothetical protein
MLTPLVPTKAATIRGNTDLKIVGMLDQGYNISAATDGVLDGEVDW